MVEVVGGTANVSERPQEEPECTQEEHGADREDEYATEAEQEQPALEAIELMLQRRARRSGHDFSPNRAKGLSEVYRRFHTLDNQTGPPSTGITSERASRSGRILLSGVVEWLYYTLQKNT